VALNAPATARSLIFAADGYTLSGPSTLTLTNAGSGGAGANAIAVTYANTMAIISCPLTSGQTVTKLDEGALRLEGNTAITGNLNIGGGSVILAGNSVTNVSGNTRVGISYTPSGTQLPTFNGTLTIQDNAVLNTQYIYMGENINSEFPGMVAIVNQTGGTVTTSGVDGEGNGIRIGHWPSETSTYNLSGGTLTIGNNAELALAIDGTGIFNLSGTGVLNTRTFVVNARTGNASGSGTWNVTGGTANIGAGGIINESTGTAYAVNLGGGIIRATAGFSSTLPMTLTGINGDITFDTNGFNVSLTGNLSGAGGLTKTGAGILTLSGTESYTGTTTVNGGILNATGATNFPRDVVVGPGGSLSPATGAFRQLNVGRDYTQNGTLLIELGGPTQGVLYDWLNVTNLATLGGTMDINITTPFPVTAGMYFDILVAAAGITNDLSGVGFNVHGADLGYSLWAFIVPMGGSAEALRLVVAPEPTTMALLGLGALCLWRRQRPPARR